MSKRIRNVALHSIIAFIASFSLTQILYAQLDSSQTADGSWDTRFGELGIDGTVLAMTVSGTDIVVGGSFSSAGQVTANNLARWDGDQWHAFTSGTRNGTNGSIFALAPDGDDLIVGGSFTGAGDVAANNIARWDGSDWIPLGSGTNGDVRAIAIHNNDIFVGGVFSSAGGQTSNNIAKWDGSQWSTLGSAGTEGVNGPVFALVAKDNDIFVGGSFTQAATQSANNIAKWDTGAESWTALGSGVNLDVIALVSDGDNIYAGGLFTTAGALSVKKIGRWDGAAWNALGTGMSGGDIHSLAMLGSELYAAGSFTSAGMVTANSIAKWDSSKWSSLGNGILGGLVFALATKPSEVYAGGSFTTAGGNASNSFANWTKANTVSVALSSFEGTALSPDLVSITWITTREENNAGFKLERRLVDLGDTWQEIAFMEGSGNASNPNQYNYKDTPPSGLTAFSGRVKYRLEQIDIDGRSTYYGPIEINFASVPEQISLKQNYPNPFNPVTVIEFSLQNTAFTSLKIYDVLGIEVASYINNVLEPGQHRFVLNGRSMPNGIYFYKVVSGRNQSPMRRMILLK